MANYTSLATLHGEVFTEKNPAFVKVLNDLGIKMEDLQPLIETIISESGKTHDILNKKTNHSLNELDKTVKLFEKKFRRYIVDQENNGQGIHGNVKVDNFPGIQEVDGEVSINNLPDDYPDKKVKDELALIKQGIEENKATNQLILDRLDGTIDTQVTGSNVELRDSALGSVSEGAVLELELENLIYRDLVISFATTQVRTLKVSGQGFRGNAERSGFNQKELNTSTVSPVATRNAGYIVVDVINVNRMILYIEFPLNTNNVSYSVIGRK